MRPLIRQRESFHLTIRPDVLKRASENFFGGAVASKHQEPEARLKAMATLAVAVAGGAIPIAYWCMHDTILMRKPTSGLESYARVIHCKINHCQARRPRNPA